MRSTTLPLVPALTSTASPLEGEIPAWIPLGAISEIDLVMVTGP
ncbi:MAG: hypothetical protein ACJ76Q_09140 [Solirubrobacteraceae bacterium]